MTADFTLSEGEASKRPAVAGSIKTTAQELIIDLTEILQEFMIVILRGLRNKRLWNRR